jgi:hypothetical protein
MDPFLHHVLGNNLFTPNVTMSFYVSLVRIRHQIIFLMREMLPSGNYDEMCFSFQTSLGLLMACFDAMALFTEKKLAPSPCPDIVEWDNPRVFIDPKFKNLKDIRDRTSEYILKGGITMNILRNMSKYYFPWIPHAESIDDNLWDIRFTIDLYTKSGPVVRELLVPLYNDACEAYLEVCKLMDITPNEIDLL